ncbi:two-component system response regulator [Salmonella enterica]|nr:two-component system response regulator [Salmonella enterica]EEH2850944.1 two-component system response regulator [Salmonella enterica]
MPYSAVIFITENQDSSVLKRWRKSGISVPVIVISKFCAVNARVAFLNAGADDWLPAPAAPEEVIARIRAILRRNHTISDVVLRHGELIFAPAARKATFRGVPLKLTTREMTLLEMLLLHHPRLLTRQYLEEHLSTWQQDISSNIIQVHISNLRRKLGDKIIQTVHGQGYRLMELNNKNQHLF